MKILTVLICFGNILGVQSFFHRVISTPLPTYFQLPIRTLFFSETDLVTTEQPKKYKMKDWLGSPEIKEECLDIIQFLQHKETFKKTQTKIPRGILLEGPPGTGKTLLAKIIANEANIHFISLSASEFIELYVGMGASRVRKVFKEAREKKPTIIFIDEIDAVGKNRGLSLSGNGNDERDQTLNQLLVELDGFQEQEDIFVIAATNRLDLLDPALLRPGRFDRIVHIPLPDSQSRLQIFKHYLQFKNYNESSWSFDKFSGYMDGFSGADIFNLVNEGSIYMIKDQQEMLLEIHIMKALEKLWLGIPKYTEDRPLEIQKRIAIHEIGHAFLAHYFSHIFDFQKVSIQNTYKGIGGYTLYKDILQEGIYGLPTKDYFEKKLMILLAGKVAEDIYFGFNHTSIGCIHDLKVANELAYKMVYEFGFNSVYPFLYFHPGLLSEVSRSPLEKYMFELLETAYFRAKEILSQYKDSLDLLMTLLLEKKQLEKEDFIHFFHHHSIPLFTIHDTDE